MRTDTRLRRNCAGHAGIVAASVQPVLQRSTRTVGQVSLLALTVGLALGGSALPAFGQTLPTGGSVVAGSATITQGGGQMTVRQATDRGIINWQTFNVGAGGRVDFQQPNAGSATLNRVTGGTTSVIAGQITANGQVFLVNPNGIQITPTGTVRTGAFVASTLDIRNQDFLAGRHVFEGNGSSASVVNQGTIEVAPGGAVVLMGGRVANDGTIVANGGRVGFASAERVTVDLQGDGFLQVSVPTADADRAEALIKHTGRITANGGRVQMRAATTADVARAAINVTGAIEARTVTQVEGGVVFGAAPSGAPGPVLRGKVTIDGGAGGSVKVSGAITARGAGRGGDISISGRSVTTTGTFDVSGGSVGGTITIDGGARLDASGIFLANGGTVGGRIDVTADDVRVTQATLSATGGDTGGLIRVGGAFQGGNAHDNAPEVQAAFVTRWADAPDVRNATETRVGASTTIDVSGGSTGGTAVVWSNNTTWMYGAVKATGARAAGAVEISGKQELAFVDLGKVEIGAGGQLLLDPRIITINTGGSSPADSGSNEWVDNPSGSASISTASIVALLNAGTSVTLHAHADINVFAGWTVTGSTPGALTLAAGRIVRFLGVFTIDTNGGDFNISANDAGATSLYRGIGSAFVDMTNLTLNAGSGNVSIQLSHYPAPTLYILLGSITGNNISVSFTQPTVAGSVRLSGDLTASGGITLPDRNIIVSGNRVLTSGSSGTVTWTGETTGRSIVGNVGGETIRFVEGTTLTRIGVLDTSDAARLTLPAGSNTSRLYGDSNPVIATTPTLVSGQLRGSDTVDTLLVAGSIGVTWSGGGAPSTTTPVGTHAYSVGATAGIAFDSGRRGYFLNTAPVGGTLTIDQRPLTVTADARTRVYGDADPALTYQITSGSLVSGDTLGGALTRVAGENVGTYAIQRGTLDNANYVITYVGADLTIDRRPITVTADDMSRVESSPDPIFTWTVTAGSVAFGDIPTGTPTRDPGETPGTYAITRGTLGYGSNYALTFVNGVLTIQPQPTVEPPPSGPLPSINVVGAGGPGSGGNGVVAGIFGNSPAENSLPLGGITDDGQLRRARAPR